MSDLPSFSEHADAATILIPETREAYRQRVLATPPQPSNTPPAPAGDRQDTDPRSSREGWPSHPNYELLREIGRGRYATVYEAYERTLRRYVAVKKLENPFHDDGYHRELFWTEARFLASREHPNIIKVFAVDEQRGWIIMELMSGCLERKKAEGPLDPDLVRSILRQALEGLGWLHQQGRIHGEVKPGNLLIDDQGRVKLSDSPGFTAGGGFRIPVGVQRHVAPELLCSEAFGPIGQAVDLYCLGFAALELLAGPDFDAIFKGVSDRESNQELGWMRWHRSTTERLPPLRKILPRLPEDLVRVIEGLTRKEVSDRYASADAALEDLEDRPLMMVGLENALGQRRRASDPGLGVTVPSLYSRSGQAARSPSATPVLSTWLNRMRDPERIRALWKQPAVRISAIGFAALVLLALLSAILSSPSSQETTLARCEVEVSSEPAGAEITLDDRRTAMTTPQTVSLAPGSHRLRLGKAGYRPAVYAFEIQAGETRLPIRLTLQRESLPAEETEPPEDGGGSGDSGHNKDQSRPPTVDPPEGSKGDGQPTGIALPLAEPVEPTSERAHYYPLEPYRVHQVRWELPGNLTTAEQAVYVEHLRRMLDVPWSDGIKRGLAAAAEMQAAAVKVCPADPRSNHAYALVLWKHHYLEEAVAQLEESASKIPWPYFAPRRQLIWHRILRGEEQRAAAECAELLRESIRFANAGWPGSTKEQRLVAADMLDENTHYAACIFAYIQACAVGGSRSRTQYLSYELQFSERLPQRAWRRFVVTKERCLRELARATAVPGISMDEAGLDRLGSTRGDFLRRRIPLTPSELCAGLAEVSLHCFPTDLEYLRDELLRTLPEKVDERYAVRF